MVTGSKELIRDINTNLVMKTIMEDGAVSRADISKKLGLTKATISAIVQSLIQRNLVKEIGTGNIAMGRKPVLLAFVQDCGYVISIDISPSLITVLVSTLGGQNCTVKQYPNPNLKDTIIPLLIELIDSHKKEIPDCPYGLVGISLGIHGIVNDHHVIFTPYSPYSALDFKDVLEKHLGIPVLLENEANLSILGEFSFYYHHKNMVGISVHSGVGLGIIINGRLYNGAGGYAGEFGHSIIEVNGRNCPCGNKGCFEQYASEKALLQEFSARKGKDTLSMDDFAKSYQSQEKDALIVMEHFVQYMSIGINNILNTLNPDIIVINSGFTMNFPCIIDDIKRSIQSRLHAQCDIVPSGLQDMSILLGGVCMVRDDFLT